MRLSSESKKLIKRIRLLELRLLPAQQKVSGYTSEQRDLIASYVLLAHAEIESFLELCADLAADRALDRWKSAQVCTKTMSRLLLFHHSRAQLKDPCRVGAKEIERAVAFFKNEVRQNHGIKEKNVLSLFLPLGVAHSDLDSVWLATVNSFGQKRGDSAHTWAKTRQQIDPKTVRTEVNDVILPNLSRIARMIGRLK
jgi:hypothetical protein